MNTFSEDRNASLLALDADNTLHTATLNGEIKAVVNEYITQDNVARKCALLSRTQPEHS